MNKIINKMRESVTPQIMQRILNMILNNKKYRKIKKSKNKPLTMKLTPHPWPQKTYKSNQQIQQTNKNPIIILTTM